LVKDEIAAPLKKPHAAPRLYEVMLADQANRARLCALCAFFLDETDFRADPQSAVGPIEHRIAVKIDFAAVGRFDEAALIRRQYGTTADRNPMGAPLYLRTYVDWRRQSEAAL